MANTNPTDPGDPISPAAADEQVRSGVLVVLLAEHPTELTDAELIRELTRDPEDFGERDAVERAVRDLVGVGLLHRQGIFVLPTRAALHFERLESKFLGGQC